MTYDVVLLPGDGVGPEVIDATVRVLDALAAAADLALEYTTLLAGGAAIDAYGTPLRPQDLERCRQADAIMLGAVGGPRWDDLSIETRPERALLQLRSELGLGINLRPVRVYVPERSSLRPELVRGADIAFIRELNGGIYFGRPSGIDRGAAGGRAAVDTSHYTEAQITAALDFAFALARRRRRKVTSVDKANVLNTSRLWREIARERAASYPDVELEHALVDSFAPALVQDPRRYDVVVTENLFGDILTDLAAALTGTLGVLPSASMRPQGTGSGPSLYEPVHGSAPTLAGRNMANPIGCLLSGALMLEWSFDRPDLAGTLRTAVERTVADGIATADLATGPAVTTDEFVTAVCARLSRPAETAATVTVSSGRKGP